MEVEQVIPEVDLRTKIPGKPAPVKLPEPAPLFASCDVQFKTAKQIAIDKREEENRKKKLRILRHKDKDNLPFGKS